MAIRPASMLALLLWLIAGPASAAEGPVVIDVPLAGGGHQRLLYRNPDGAVALAVIFPGGAGRIGIGAEGRVAAGRNFLVRTRERWHAAGIATALLDTPSYTQDLFGQRLDRAYAEAIRATVAALRQRTPLPIWLVGTSAGTVGAAHAAANLSAAEIAGLVLTSSMTVTGNNVRTRESVLLADLGRVAVPTLIGLHTGDRCAFTPPALAERIKAKLTAAPAVEILSFSGGDPPAEPNPCEALTEHGFIGIEQSVVEAIAGRMKALSPAIGRR